MDLGFEMKIIHDCARGLPSLSMVPPIWSGWLWVMVTMSISSGETPSASRLGTSLPVVGVRLPAPVSTST